MGPLVDTMYSDTDLVSSLIEQPAFEWQQQPPIFDCALLKDWGTLDPYLQQPHAPAVAAAAAYDAYDSSHGFQATPVSVLDYVHQSEAEDSSTITHQQQQQQQQQQHYHQQPPHQNYGVSMILQQQQHLGEEDPLMDAQEIQQLLAGFSSSQPLLPLVPYEDDTMMMIKVEKLAEELESEILSSGSSNSGSGFLLEYQFQQQRQPVLSPMSSQGSSYHSPRYKNIVHQHQQQLSQQHRHHPYLYHHQQQPQQPQQQELGLVQAHQHQQHDQETVLFELHNQQQRVHRQQPQLVTPNLKVEQVGQQQEQLDFKFVTPKSEDDVGGVYSNNGSTASSSSREVVLSPQQQQQQQPHHHQQQYYVQLPLKMDDQLHLVRLLISCANAVSERNLELAHATLVQLRSLVVPHGSPMQRLASYVCQALAARLNRDTGSSRFKGLVWCDQLQRLSVSRRSDMLEAFGVFYEYVPIGKFAHLTMNQILLEACERESAIHIVDFQLWYGAQWPSLLQSLAMRPGGPPSHVRMTAVGSSLRDLQEAGAKLRDTAHALGLSFEYCIVNVSIENFESSMVELREGEALVVNSLSQFHCFLKAEDDDGSFTSPLTRFLQGIRSLRPKLVVMTENDADHNSPAFFSRFMACLQYYSAVFDAFDASLPMPTASAGRNKLEELIAAQKLRNMIACEGSERVERHESLRAWNSRMEAAGFRAVSLSNKAISQANLLLRLYFSDGYTLSNQDGFLTLGWRGMPFNGVAAWIC